MSAFYFTMDYVKHNLTVCGNDVGYIELLWAKYEMKDKVGEFILDINEAGFNEEDGIELIINYLTVVNKMMENRLRGNLILKYTELMHMAYSNNFIDNWAKSTAHLIICKEDDLMNIEGVDAEYARKAVFFCTNGLPEQDVENITGHVTESRISIPQDKE